MDASDAVFAGPKELGGAGEAVALSAGGTVALVGIGGFDVIIDQRRAGVTRQVRPLPYHL